VRTVRDGRAAAVDVGGSKLALAVVAPDLTLTRRTEIASRGRPEAELIASVHAWLSDAAVEAPCCVGVASPGIVDAAGRVALAANLPQWEGPSIAGLLEKITLPTAIVNDVKAAALAEARRGSGQDASIVLYVNLGTGFAVAVTVDGRLETGAHGAAGELGYWVGASDDEGARAGKTPLEARIGGWGVAARARMLGHDLSAAEVAAADAPTLRTLWLAVADEAARAVANAATFADPDVVVLGGGMSRDPRLRAAIEDAVARFVPVPPPVRTARFGRDAGLIGAALAAWDRATTTASGDAGRDAGA
jgi:glucokinase